MSDNIALSIQVVKGGFILQTFIDMDSTSEVFVSQGKLLKAIRTVLDGDAPAKENAPKDAE